MEILTIPLFFVGDLQNTDIVFSYPSTSLWACCFRGADRDCSSMYSASIVPSLPCSLSRRRYGRGSLRDIGYPITRSL